MNLFTRASRLAISPLPVPTAWYAIPLRLIVGLGFVQHGYAKLARGPDDFINVLHALQQGLLAVGDIVLLISAGLGGTVASGVMCVSSSKPVFHEPAFQ